MDKERVNEAMGQLRAQFRVKLPARLAEIDARAALLDAAEPDGEQLQVLHRLVHGLSGSAGTFGMHSLGEAARRVERLLEAWCKAGEGDSRQMMLGELRAALQELKQLAHSASHMQAPSLREPAAALEATAESEPMLYFVDDEPLQGERMCELLQEAGYRVRHFDCLEAFGLAMQSGGKPAAVIMDMVFPEGDLAGAEYIQSLKQQCRGDFPPVLFLSVRRDLNARLAAYRSGSVHYLNKPVDPDRLLRHLDELTHRIPKQPYRVLMVDDDPLILEAQASILQAAGMAVTTLNEPSQTLDQVEAIDPEVLVLDFHMPGITGPQLAALLREDEGRHQLPIIYLSAETDEDSQSHALDLGGDDFLVKPVSPEKLVSRVWARARRARESQASRTLMQQLLYEREREHLALNHHAIVSIADRVGNITYINDLFCDVSGYACEELLGKNHRLLKSGQHPDSFYQEMWATIVSGQVWSGEVCNRRKDGSFYWVESTIVPFVDTRGKPYQYVSIRTDISHVKAAEAAQKMVSEAANALLSAGADTLDATIERCLQQVGGLLGADRAYLFLLCDDGAHVSNSHEWCAPGIAPQKETLQNMPVDALAWWWERMQHGDMINIPDVDAMPAECAAEKTLLESQDIRAVCAFPIQRAGLVEGFIGFDQVTTAREWNEQALALLSLMADQMGSALQRAADELALAESADRLSATLESTKDGILAVGTSGEVLFMNRQFRQMWSMPEPMADAANDQQLLAHALTQLVDPEGFMAKVQALYQSGEESDDLIELNDGRVFERHSKPLRNHGLTPGRVWSFHDITDRCLAERAAKAAMERLRRGQLYANIGTWEWNIVTGDLFWTERIAPLFGYPLGDLETSYDNFLAAVHPDDRQAVMDAVGACLEHDVPYDIEHRVIWPDGTVRWLLERGAVKRDADGRPLQMIGVVQDIDDRKQAQQALVAALEVADRASRAKSEFLSSMSHELRTPMNAILGFGQLIEFDATLPQEHQDNVKEILKAGQHLLSLINEVLDLAKVESGNIDLSLEPVELCSVVDECLSLVGPLARKRHIVTDAQGIQGATVRADRTRLKQVVLNLLSNAIKYNRVGGRVIVDAEPGAADSLRLRVSDTGPAIPEDRLAELFQPFTRLDAENSEVEGTGIGLTITRRIVEMMGGTVGVRSEPGTGSTFWVELPLEMHSADEEGGSSVSVPESRTQATVADTTTRQTVLYIEDNPANLKLVTQILGRVPRIHLLTAHTSSLGVELAMARQPALILLDINLPGMNGYQVLEVLRADARLKHTPVIAITANAMPRDIERGEAAGFADYLTKPLDVARFLRTVQNCLERG